MVKICSKCGIEKPIGDFSKRKNRKVSSTWSYCKPCQSFRSQERIRALKGMGMGNYQYGANSKTREESQARKRFTNQRYKVRKRNAVGGHSYKEWMVLKEYYKNLCLCCKRQEPDIKLTEDHIMPLSLGGTDNIENIQPLCQSCNTRKHARYISYLPPSENLNLAEKGMVN